MWEASRTASVREVFVVYGIVSQAVHEDVPCGLQGLRLLSALASDLVQSVEEIIFAHIHQ